MTSLQTTKHPEVSFSAKIEALEEYNTNLVQEVYKWIDQANTESELRQQVEREANLLRELNQKLELEAQNNERRLEHFSSDLAKHARILNKVSPLLQELRLGVSLGKAGDLC